MLRDDEDALTAAVIGLARSFGRYGYKRITGLLQMAGWQVNAKRVQRIAAPTKLFETTFVFPPSHTGADYHLRIFSK